MHTPGLSRRQFALLAGSGLAAAQAARGQNGKITAREVIERIQKEVGVPWRSETVDTFKAGDPDTPVQGIAVTVMSTLEMLQRAAKAGKNLIITHEPTFYNHRDETKDMTNDAVYKFKQDFIAKNNMVIWRFHDHWHARSPDPVAVGLAKTMGWERHQVPGNELRYALPEATLGDLARNLQRRMKIRTMRVVGEPVTRISKAAISPGYSGLDTAMKDLPEVDLFVGGEIREWEGVEYAFDAVAAGQPKGLILLGHCISEDPGMKECATWLETFVKEAPIEFIPAGEPAWRPA